MASERLSAHLLFVRMKATCNDNSCASVCRVATGNNEGHRKVHPGSCRGHQQPASRLFLNASNHSFSEYAEDEDSHSFARRIEKEEKSNNNHENLTSMKAYQDESFFLARGIGEWRTGWREGWKTEGQQLFTHHQVGCRLFCKLCEFGTRVLLLDFCLW